MDRLKIVYPICCGMDVHRDFVIACIATTNVQGVTEYQSRRFSTYTEELRELKAWLDDNNCKDVCFKLFSPVSPRFPQILLTSGFAPAIIISE